MELPVLKIGEIISKYPIIQGGMAVRISTAPLAVAVANAGGIGIIAATGMSPAELKKEIQWARSNSQGIIGINIMFAARGFKELTLTALEEGIDLVIQGAGFSRDIFTWCQEAKTAFVSIVSTTKLAKMAEKLGANALVVEGKEAGGHLGTERSVKDILPEIRQSVSIPLIAAGGIITAEDMLEMFRLGAQGVQMGTRFAASKESNAAPNLKEFYLRARKEELVLIESPVGLPGRAIENVFTKKIRQGYPPKNCRACLKKCSKSFCIMDALINAQEGNLEEALIFSGEKIDKINKILSAEEIIQKLIWDYQNF